MAVFVFMTRRVLVAVVLTGALLAILRTASVAKQGVTDLPLHAYDLVTLSMSWPAQAALWTNHRSWILGLVAAVALSAMLAAVAWRFDGTRVRRRHALAAILVSVASVWLATVVRGERMHDEMFEVNSRLALFFASWNETSEALIAGTGGRSGGRSRRRPAPGSRHLQSFGEAAAHHPDPRGIGGAAVAVSRAQLRQERRSVLSFA